MVTADLDRLQAALVGAIPARTETNLLVGTWNIRALGDLTEKWLAGPKDSPKRDWHAVACLAAMISRFDVVAVQESHRNPAALKRLLGSLGPGWRVIVSDVTEGTSGNQRQSERCGPRPAPGGEDSCLSSRHTVAGSDGGSVAPPA